MQQFTIHFLYDILPTGLFTFFISKLFNDLYK